MTTMLSRRRFVGSLGLSASAALVARAAGAATPPKETGLSSEGLLVGRAGFQPRTTMPLPHEALPGFLSKEQLGAHHAEYAQIVARLAETEHALQAADLDGSRYGDLRRTQVETANGVLLHELYFTGLTPAAVEPPRYLQGHMHEHMGSFDQWRDDFRRCALAAKAWAVLVYDPYDDRWHDVVMDSERDGVWVGANPLVVCDVSEHAFAKDYPRREDYVEKFLAHVDWDEVARRYHAVDRM
jgi:Fe-Mn family superoxide dismutase